MSYQECLKKLQKQLKKEKCDAFLIQDVIDLYYMTGLSLSVGKLIVKEEEALLLVDGRYIETCEKFSPFPVTLYKELPLKGIKRLGFCKDQVSYQQYLDLKELKATPVPIENPIKKLRMIKDEGEVKALKDAAQLGSLGYDHVLGFLKEGITEKEVAIELEIFWLKHGGSLAFDPIIAFGANGSMPHYRPGNIPLKKGDSVLIDIGVKLNHYNSDMTRVAFFGKPKPKMKEIYQVVLEAQEAALKLCHPGTRIGDLDAAARNHIADKGYGENFTHSLGHGIGLEVHEDPFLRNKGVYKRMTLKEGMAITIEPGVYLPGIGGVRIEDTVMITEDGHENLTNRTKKMFIL